MQDNKEIVAKFILADFQTRFLFTLDADEIELLSSESKKQYYFKWKPRIKSGLVEDYYITTIQGHWLVYVYKKGLL